MVILRPVEKCGLLAFRQKLARRAVEYASRTLVLQRGATNPFSKGF